MPAVLNAGGYDGAGNIIERTDTAGRVMACDYTYEPVNRLVSFEVYNFSYDDNGNTLVKDGLLADYYYTYDFENRLTEALYRQYLLEPSPEEPVPVIYKYDALGRRVERSQADVGVQRYVYDGQDVIADLDENDQVVTSYFNGPGTDNKLRQTDSTNGNLYFTTDISVVPQP
ncbi:MAG TPA: hypothetical protein VGO68_20815 [Pyrinomonadaceae bacterium]|nr:hypothetical protein [Pyrinomonadaceae bacterium]